MDTVKSNLYQAFASEPYDHLLRAIIVEVLEFLKSVTIMEERGPRGSGQPAKQVSELHAFRRRSNYYKAGAIVGLDETIVSLERMEGNVRLGVIETDHGIVALWLNEQGSISGVMIMKTAGTSS